MNIVLSGHVPVRRNASYDDRLTNTLSNIGGCVLFGFAGPYVIPRPLERKIHCR